MGAVKGHMSPLSLLSFMPITSPKDNGNRRRSCLCSPEKKACFGADDGKNENNLLYLSVRSYGRNEYTLYIIGDENTLLDWNGRGFVDA